MIDEIKPGLYVEFFHGRPTPKEQMDDWGTSGPIVGPLDFCHVTYGSELKLSDNDQEDALVFNIEDGLVRIGDTWYGDFSAFHLKDPAKWLEKDDLFVSLTQLKEMDGRKA